MDENHLRNTLNLIEQTDYRERKQRAVLKEMKRRQADAHISQDQLDWVPIWEKLDSWDWLQSTPLYGGLYTAYRIYLPAALLNDAEL